MGYDTFILRDILKPGELKGDLQVVCQAKASNEPSVATWQQHQQLIRWNEL